MFSIIIPTMWRYAPFPAFLRKLVAHPLVNDIVLINNDVSRTPDDFWLPPNSKITHLPQAQNIGVNPAWNLGVRFAKTDRLCILNDDLEFDLEVFAKVLPFVEPTEGNIFICPGQGAPFNQPPVTDGAIDIIPWDGHNRFGYGMMMFVHADNFIPFHPVEMKLYFGDNLLFEIPLNNRRRRNYLITNMRHQTPYAATCSALQTPEEADARMRQEFLHYEAYKRTRLETDLRILTEYLWACETPSDINEHVSTLYAVARQCDDVVELGVRTGVSTRAFLRAAQFGIRLRSYDLVLDHTVQRLFWDASRAQYPVSYEKADSRTVEIGETDLLFIDTWHTADVLSAELRQHGSKVRKFMAFHDTAMTSAGQELQPVIKQFLNEHPEWFVFYETDKNNGLLVLAKKKIQQNETP